MHIHLDALGGVAGDMFAAALLDAFPEHQDGVRASVRAVDARIACAVHPHNDGILSGARFLVSGPDAEPGPSEHGHHTHAGPDHGHHHDPATEPALPRRPRRGSAPAQRATAEAADQDDVDERLQQLVSHC